MKLYTPAEVGLVADYDKHSNYDKDPDGWVGHYPGVDRLYTGELADTFKALRGFEKYGMSKGWWGLAYDYWVDLGGNAGVGRGTARSGATSGDYDEDGIPNNNETDAILFVIGTNQEATQEMLEATYELIHELGGLRDYFVPHNKAKGIQTACPGDSVREKIIAPINAGKAPDEVEVRPNPPTTVPTPVIEPKSTDWRDDLYKEMSQVNLRGVTDHKSTWFSGPHIKVLQAICVAQNVAPRNTIKSNGSLDGVAGPGTKAALEKLQRKLGLRPDIIAGPITYKAALGGLDMVDASGVTSNYRTWVRGRQVEIVQALLVANGMAPANTIDSTGDVDGVAGPGTKAAIKEFQTKKRLADDAIVGPKTYRELLVK